MFSISYFSLSLVSIVFDFSLSLRRLYRHPALSAHGCGYTRSTFQQNTHLIVCVFREREECGHANRQMYILFIVMIFQSNEIFYFIFQQIQRLLEMATHSIANHITQSRFQSHFFLAFFIYIALLYWMRFWSDFHFSERRGKVDDVSIPIAIFIVQTSDFFWGGGGEWNLISQSHQY